MLFVCVHAYVYFSLYKYIFTSIYIRISIWYKVMRVQTSRGGRWVYSYKSSIIVDKIDTVVTCVFIKYISGFKIIWNTSIKNIIKNCLQGFHRFDILASSSEELEFPFLGDNNLFGNSAENLGEHYSSGINP